MSSNILFQIGQEHNTFSSLFVGLLKKTQKFQHHWTKTGKICVSIQFFITFLENSYLSSLAWPGNYLEPVLCITYFSQCKLMSLLSAISTNDSHLLTIQAVVSTTPCADAGHTEVLWIICCTLHNHCTPKQSSYFYNIMIQHEKPIHHL